MSLPTCRFRFRTGSRKFEDGYSIELSPRLPRHVFQQRMDNLNNATRAVLPTPFMVALPFLAAFLSIVLFVIFGIPNLMRHDSKSPFKRGGVDVPFWLVSALMIAGFVGTAVLSRIADVRLKKTITQIINEYNQMDNPNGINWRTLTYDAPMGYNTEGQPSYARQLMLEIQVEPVSGPQIYCSYQRSTPERCEYVEPSILEEGRYQGPPIMERCVYGEQSTMEPALPPPYKLVDAK